MALPAWRLLVTDLAAMPLALAKRLRTYGLVAVDRRLRRRIAERLPAPPYTEVLSALHDALRPRGYLEIGIASGDSLALSRAERTVGVDPDYHVVADLSAVACRLYRETSDAFFARPDDGERYDLTFLDGSHLFEQTLRDFLHAERRSAPGATIAIHDVLPVARILQTRRRLSYVWSGDVWKLVYALRDLDPSPRIRLIEAPPSGLMLVTNPTPERRLDETAILRIESAHRSRPFPGLEALRAAYGSDRVPPDAVSDWIERLRAQRGETIR